MYMEEGKGLHLPPHPGATCTGMGAGAPLQAAALRGEEGLYALRSSSAACGTSASAAALLGSKKACMKASGASGTMHCMHWVQPLRSDLTVLYHLSGVSLSWNGAALLPKQAAVRHASNGEEGMRRQPAW